MTIPIYGKLSDLLGRKPIFLFGIVVFLIGSALCGVAQSMTQLIVFRGLQGIGDGALLPIASAVVGDLFPPRERGKWQGVTGSVYALSAIIGPLAGGWLTDHLSWRWIFYVNLPFGFAALLVLIFLMPTLRVPVKQVFIDYLGVLLLVLGTLPLLLALSWAGSQYAWLSPQISGLLAAAVVLLTLLVLYAIHLERQGKEPIFEPSLFTTSVRIFSVSLLVTMILNIALVGCAYFLPLFIQGVIGASATNSGLVLVPFSAQCGHYAGGARGRLFPQGDTAAERSSVGKDRSDVRTHQQGCRQTLLYPLWPLRPSLTLGRIQHPPLRSLMHGCERTLQAYKSQQL